MWWHARKDCSLNRSLYGLKQSRRQWAGLLVETVVEYGMEQCRIDPCVFRMVVHGKVELIMAVHVDDNVIAEWDETCRDFHTALTTKFPTNILGDRTWYTGCAFKRNWELGTIEITQKAFVESCLLYTSPSPRDATLSRMPSSA